MYYHNLMSYEGPTLGRWDSSPDCNQTKYPGNQAYARLSVSHLTTADRFAHWWIKINFNASDNFHWALESIASSNQLVYVASWTKDKRAKCWLSFCCTICKAWAISWDHNQLWAKPDKCKLGERLLMAQETKASVLSVLLIVYYDRCLHTEELFSKRWFINC